MTLAYTGRVTDSDLFRTYEQLYDDPEHQVGMGELADLSRAESLAVTSVALQALARWTARRLD